jgi:hypothetical protein
MTPVNQRDFAPGLDVYDDIIRLILPNYNPSFLNYKGGNFMTKLAHEELRGAELEDLQSFLADEMRVSNSPMGCPTEVSPVLVPVQPRTWDEWLSDRNLSGRMPTTRRSGKQANADLPSQLSI